MKPTEISKAVRQLVWERDGGKCIYCNKAGFSNVHVFVSRAHGGLGVKENVGTLCMLHHHWLDNGLNRQHKLVKEKLYEYMYSLYPDLEIDNLRYKKHKIK